jgi:hypothetical protein
VKNPIPPPHFCSFSVLFDYFSPTGAFVSFMRDLFALVFNAHNLLRFFSWRIWDGYVQDMYGQAARQIRFQETALWLA